MSRQVAHVLLDADGVLQRGPADPVGAVSRQLGVDARPLLNELWAAEGASLDGRELFRDRAAIVVSEVLGPGSDPHQVYDLVWRDLRVDPGSHALVDELRRCGLGVHLGTNQHPERRTTMRELLGYDAWFDTSVYSCEIGHRKPDPRFFRRAVELIGAAPDEIVLVDDLAENVAAARAAGLRALHWHLDDGHGLLWDELIALGVRRTSTQEDE